MPRFLVWRPLTLGGMIPDSRADEHHLRMVRDQHVRVCLEAIQESPGSGSDQLMVN